MIENLDILDEIITGYVPHRIYAFSTPQLLGYLKVGETSRSVNVRLAEWKKSISDLKLENDWLAMLPKDSKEQTEFFQDYALHNYFKRRGFQPLDYNVAPGNSREFYPVTIKDIEMGIDDIANDYLSEPPREYTYLSIEDNSRVEEHWERNQDFNMREDQQTIINNIVAVSKDDSVPHNYLLFAVMRFGKTFVALEAAKALDAKLTVIVSAKADVKSEWKKNLESHIDFEGYKFLDSNDLKNNDTAIQAVLDSNERVVLFLTLQDLNGADIKKKHKQLFDRIVDLLIVDESHFGARAQCYGQVIHKWVGSDKKRKLKIVDAYEDQVTDDKEDNDEVKGLKNVKAINASYTLHLSGTPYRMLMGGEFDNPKQIVGKVQFEDILEEKAKWYEEHLGEQEWKNPYFGFPQMIRFAFNLSDAVMAKLKVLTTEGNTSRLNELFGPVSNKKSDPEHLKFKHEDEVLKTLKALDGKENSESIFPILNYEKIKEGKMAHHIVIVLPYKASCDAMAELLSRYNEKFFNFCDYEVINIAGHDSVFNNQGKPATEKIKAKISELSKKGKKTISLTVNKMLTGVTVPQWDTMIFLKDTQSPQEYDQAIYRLQSPYVTYQYDNEGNIVNMEDLKPQTLLIDFAPNRMMSIEQYKAFIFSASENGAGNDKIEQSLERQMNFSPIITMNAEKLTQVQPEDVLKYIAEYSSEKGIIEEASEISVDLSILDNSLLKAVIQNENEIGGKLGLKFNQNKNSKDSSDEDKRDSNDTKYDSAPKYESTSNDTNIGREATEKEKLEKKVQNYYLRILFYAFLSEETGINNLSDVVSSYDNNQRLARHLGLEKSVLEVFAQELRQPFVRSSLDNKISNANALLADDSVKASEKVGRAIQSFKRISENEIFTPRHITELMIDNLLADMNLSNFNQQPKKFIDLTSKSGIYLLVLYEKLLENDVNDNIARKALYAVTTSPIAYEFTRKVFELMKFPIKNILDIDYASSYDLISELNQSYAADGLKQYYFKGDENMKFDVVVGNPPYQENDNGKRDDGAANASASPLYHYFFELAKKVSKEKVDLIFPARWLTGAGKGLGNFSKEMLNDTHIKSISIYKDSSKIFPNTEIKGGVLYLIYDKHYDGKAEVNLLDNDGKLSKYTSYLNSAESGVFIPYGELVSIFQKIKAKENLTTNSIQRLVSGRKPFGLTTDFFKNPMKYDLPPVNSSREAESDIEIIGLENSKRITKYVSKNYPITVGLNLIKKWKVFVPYAYGSGEFGEVGPNLIVGHPGQISTETFLAIGPFDTEFEANAFVKYFKTKFFRALVGILKTTQHSTTTYRFVPKLDFTKSNKEIDWLASVDKIDEQLALKYGLNKKEIELINTKVKTMD